MSYADLKEEIKNLEKLMRGKLKQRVNASEVYNLVNKRINRTGFGPYIGETVSIKKIDIEKYGNKCKAIVTFFTKEGKEVVAETANQRLIQPLIKFKAALNAGAQEIKTRLERNDSNYQYRFT